MKAPAYARALQEQIDAGANVRLVVLSLHDWSAGKLIAERPGAVRLVVPLDVPVVDLDLSVLFGLDVLVLGGDPDDADAAQRLALASGAASVWGEYFDGFWRVVPCGLRGLLATSRYDHADALLDDLPALRDADLLTGRGVYASPAFRPARIALVGRIYGEDVAARLRQKEQKVAA